VIDSFDLEGFRALHSHCGCEVTAVSTEDRFTTIHKEGCDIRIEGLEIALDCDSCCAFTENDLRPDVISVQHCDDMHEWLILEMKSTLRPHAAEQARAALDRLGQDPMFQLDIDRARVFFIVKRMRRAFELLMREIKTIDSGRWSVTPRLRVSGDSINCLHPSTRRRPTR